MKTEFQNRPSKIAIVGAGPAGSGLAIRLAKQDFEVVLIEREKFPRHKLCGEFISPECLEHFRELEVLDEMLAVGGDRITETIFYAPNGKNVSVPSSWFGNSRGALSISRAAMDHRLMEQAKMSGVEVLEETQVTGLLFDDETVGGVRAKNKEGEVFEIAADLTIDATGRAGVLAKLAHKLKAQSSKFKAENQRPQSADRRPKFVGFKTHLENVHLEKGRCEIYFFRGGYGGLSFVENDRANHCFLIKAELVKKYIGQTTLLLEEIILKNRRARETMSEARPLFDWLAVSVDEFGVKDLHPATNLLTVGDAAAFIDPFTGSGMLMALESAGILAQAILTEPFASLQTAAFYKDSYRRKFRQRLQICSIMRRAAFVPHLAKTVISCLSLSKTMQKILVRATRQNGIWKKSQP